MKQYETKEEVIEELRNMKMWIVFNCKEELPCGELRKQLDKIDGIDEFIRTVLVYGH